MDDSHRHWIRWSSGLVIILYFSTLHSVWAWLLMTTATARDATPLALLLEIFHKAGFVLAVMLIVIAVMAVLGARYQGHLLGLVLMIPQLCLLVMSATAGVHAALAGKYADGTLKPFAHILADQLLVILSAPFYLLAILAFHGVRFGPVPPTPQRRRDDR